jgi:DNA-binding response OmpR family regulator
VQTARTAEYGLALARSTRPDAVLIDIGLPDMSGHDVGKALRADGYGGLLVAISGYGHREARERSSEVGFDHHLAKPAKLSEIAGVLAGVRGSQSEGRQPPVT